VNLLRRLPLSRLLLLCGLVVAIGIGVTALAVGLSTGPVPPAKPLAEAVHDSLAGASGQSIQGVSAQIQLTNHLVEGANLAGGGDGGGSDGGGLASSPLLTGASGRLWISSDGKARLELQSEKGDSQIIYDGHTVSLYDAASNTEYRYTPQQGSGDMEAGSDGSTGNSGSSHHHGVPTAQEIQEALAHATAHGATISAATPTDVAGRPAYTVRISPTRNGGLIGGAELSWDATNGAPLRAAIYSSTSAAPVVELAATSVSYGPVENSVFELTPPANTKIEEVAAPHEPSAGQPAPGGSSSQPAPGDTGGHSKPTVTTHGEGLAGIAVIEEQTKNGNATKTTESLEGLPQVKINGTTASELATPLGTLLTFERGGIRYLLAGSVTPASIEAFARGM
jgi:outer membrane lipoprotein-sorting protein